MDFKKLDKAVRVNHREDVYSTVNDLGYNYLSELIFDQYYNKKKSTRVIGKLINLTQFPVLNLMDKFGFKRRPRGGQNHGCKALKYPGTEKKIISLKGAMSGRAAAKIIGCSRTKVQQVWAKSN